MNKHITHVMIMWQFNLPKINLPCCYSYTMTVIELLSRCGDRKYRKSFFIHQAAAALPAARHRIKFHGLGKAYHVDLESSLVACLCDRATTHLNARGICTRAQRWDSDSRVMAGQVLPSSGTYTALSFWMFTGTRHAHAGRCTS